MNKFIPIAACFILMIAVTAFIGIQNNWFREKENTVNINSAYEHPDEAGGDYNVACIPEGRTGGYSVACFPAGRTIDEVENATCIGIYPSSLNDVNDLCDYVPSYTPSPYHWEVAGLYETTMKDGTIYRMLKITYITGNDDNTIDDTDDVLNYWISVCDFKPDISDLFDFEDLSEEILSEIYEKDIFAIKYGNHYVIIEPILLSKDETIKIINSIGR